MLKIFLQKAAAVCNSLLTFEIVLAYLISSMGISMEIDIWYEGDLSTRCVDRATGTEIRTDAPKDNQGLGRMFSPTDLVAVALGSCMLTLMGIAANRLKVEIKGTKLTIQKQMQSVPVRRIGGFEVVVDCPYTFSSSIAQELIRAAEGCPVKHSLHPDIQWKCQFLWGQL